jgi:predicted secreted protein
MSETPPPPPEDPGATPPPPPPPPVGGQPYGGQPGGAPYGQPPGQPYGGTPYGGPPYGGPPYGGPPYGGPPYGGPTGAPPPNHLVWAILSTLFCCLPLGIAAIVFASQVNSKYNVGDYAGAQESSRKARNFALWGTVIGVVIAVLWIVLLAAGLISMSGNTSTTY